MKQGEKKNLRANSLRYTILLGIIIVLIVIFSLASPQFLRLSTMMNIIRQSAALSICSIGMTLIILTGGIDLSAGSVIALAPAVGALMIQAAGGSANPVQAVMAGFLGTLLAAAAVGLVNGVLVGVCHISAFMATLATQFAARGLTLKLTNANRIVIDSALYNYLGQGCSPSAGQRYRSRSCSWRCPLRWRTLSSTRRPSDAGPTPWAATRWPPGRRESGWSGRPSWSTRWRP